MSLRRGTVLASVLANNGRIYLNGDNINSNNGDEDVKFARRIWLSSGSSYTVVIPKELAEKHRFKEAVEFVDMPDGVLIRRLRRSSKG